MTEAERQAICERIALAMGWEHKPICNHPKSIRRWFPPDACVDGAPLPLYGDLSRDPPDFFKCPVASDALMGWLRTDHHVRLHTHLSGWSIDVWRRNSIESGCREIHNDWKTALATAAGKAIEEAGRVV